MRDILCVILALGVVGTLYRSHVACPVTIQWAKIPPILPHTEWLGTIYKSIGGALDWVLTFCHVLISLTLWDIYKNNHNIRLGRRCLQLIDQQIRLGDRPRNDPWCRGSVVTQMPHTETYSCTAITNIFIRIPGDDFSMH